MENKEQLNPSVEANENMEGVDNTKPQKAEPENNNENPVNEQEQLPEENLKESEESEIVDTTKNVAVTEKGQEVSQPTEENQSVEESQPVKEGQPDKAKKSDEETQVSQDIVPLETKKTRVKKIVETPPAEEKSPKDNTESKVSEVTDDDSDLSEKYNSLTKEQLVETIQALVLNEDINYIRKHIGYIKVAFRNHLKAESVSDYEKNLQGTQDDTHETRVDETTDPLLVKFDEAFNVYKQKKYIYDQALEKQKHDNLVTKEKILEELRSLIESEEELKKTYDVFKELQEQWREIGAVPQSAKNTLWNNYHFLVEKFFDKVKINKELRDLDLKKNLESKTELCEKAEELLLETSINRSFQQLQKLHDAWKEIGPVPKDKKDEIWDRFKAATDTLNERRQGYYEGLREEQNKNYSAKLVLCEKAEQLTEFVSDSPREWQKATDQVNELFNVWKTIGFAPKKVNNQVWNRFRNALDTFFKNKKAFFLKYKDEQSENYNQKLNLCLQAEAVKDSEDWKQTTDELIALQQQWKKIGPVPNKFSDKIWKRFRAACDTFFNRKSEFFSNIGEKQDENLRMKKELIETVKNYNYTSDNNENLKVLKDFQRQWMEIGHVPIKQKDQVQNEFRKTVNEQFEKLNISKKAKSTMGFKNKIENLKNSPNADSIIYKERSFILNKISSLQNDIKLWENNIGFFASSKKADILKSEFEQKIETAKTEISILEEKLKIIRES
jgi:hypothetical protein